jgi:WD domain, G-beta repeat
MVGLIADYRRYGANKTQWSIGKKLGLISGICMRDPNQLLPQLIRRLLASETLPARIFVQKARALLTKPAIAPIRRTLFAPRAFFPRAKGDWLSPHGSALCLLADGRLAFSSDNTIRLWDATNGIETACLKGHDRQVNALCLLSDGRLASGSADNTVRLWDPAAGAETACLKAHSGGVLALCPLRDGRLASGPRTTRSGCGMWPAARKLRVLRAMTARSTRFAFCRMGGSPPGPRTARSGNGMW